MQPAGQFVILYMLAMIVVSLLLMWGIRYLLVNKPCQAKLGQVISLKKLFDVDIRVESFLTERVKISVLTSYSNHSQEGHPGPNASLDGRHVLCFVVSGCFFYSIYFNLRLLHYCFHCSWCSACGSFLATTSILRYLTKLLYIFIWFCFEWYSNLTFDV